MPEAMEAHGAVHTGQHPQLGAEHGTPETEMEGQSRHTEHNPS